MSWTIRTVVGVRRRRSRVAWRWGSQDGLVGHGGVVHQAECGAVGGRVLELLREGAAGVQADAAGGIDQPVGAASVAQLALSHLRHGVLERESRGPVHATTPPRISVPKNTYSYSSKTKIVVNFEASAPCPGLEKTGG